MLYRNKITIIVIIIVVFLIHLRISWIYVNCRVQAIFYGKHFYVGTLCVNFLATYAIWYHFQWPWLREGTTRSAFSKTCWLHFHADFSKWSGWNLIWCSSVFRGKNFWHWTLHANFSPKFFRACHACRHHGSLPFCTTFSSFDLGWGAQVQRKAKPLGFIFLTHYLTDQDECWCDIETIQDVYFIEYTSSIVLCQDTCELICFKLGLTHAKCNQTL